jgi:DUF2946 family protein
MLLVLLVLPALLFRALIPIGFMPIADHGGIHIDFCPGESQPPGALAGTELPHHHHHHGGTGRGTPASTSHPPCLFALSASPALVPAAPALAPLPPAAAPPAAAPSSRALLPAIVRAQRARAPPFPA